jgi:hypothetical protein
VIVEFATIVCLQAGNGGTELSANIGMKTNDSRQNFRLIAQGKYPNIMGMIIKNHKVIVVAKVANHQGGPQITMQEFKRSIGYVIRTSKWQTYMLTKTVGMARVIVQP